MWEVGKGAHLGQVAVCGVSVRAVSVGVVQGRGGPSSRFRAARAVMPSQGPARWPGVGTGSAACASRASRQRGSITFPHRPRPGFSALTCADGVALGVGELFPCGAEPGFAGLVALGLGLFLGLFLGLGRGDLLGCGLVELGCLGLGFGLGLGPGEFDDDLDDAVRRGVHTRDIVG